jgi:hypothetical protein
MTFVVYAPPTTDKLELPIQPLLATWEKKSHPSQQAMRKYLDAVREIAKPALGTSDDYLGLELVVGLDDNIDLTSGGRDLDNFLYPLIFDLGWHRFLTVRGEKRHGATSTIRIDRAAPTSLPVDDWLFARARTTAGVASKLWKEQVHDQIASVVAGLPQLVVTDLQVCFRVSPKINWANLWKPAIDALGPILGEGSKQFHPNDDRILRLAVHRLVDAKLGNNVELGVWWRSSTAEHAAFSDGGVLEHYEPIFVPAPNAPWWHVWVFALSYNAYDRRGGFESAAELGNAALSRWNVRNELPSDLDTARAALFFEQRRYHHFGDDPTGENERYVRSLVERIRDLCGGSVPGPGDPYP